MIEKDLFAYLTSRENIRAVIGTTPPRMYPVKAPQGVRRPYLTYRRASGGHEHTLRGAAGFALPRFVVTAWADTYDEAKQLAFTVRDNMQGFSGQMQHTKVSSVISANESDEYEEPEDGSDAGIFNVPGEFHIHYTETVTAFTE